MILRALEVSIDRQEFVPSEEGDVSPIGQILPPATLSRPAGRCLPGIRHLISQEQTELPA